MTSFADELSGGYDLAVASGRFSSSMGVVRGLCVPRSSLAVVESVLVESISI
ncbi:MAG: hypothetical protein ACPGPS_16045 [Rubripirellula sp.]